MSPAPALARRDLETRAERAAAHLPGLLVAAQRIAANVVLGSHGRRRPGMGESFWQFRPYGPDDTPGRIDWRQSARSDTLYVREREWTAAQTVALWCDLSPSMQFRSRKEWPTKAERAAVLALALGIVLVEGGEKILRLSSEGTPVRAATAGRLALSQMADHLARDLAAPDDNAGDAPFPSFTQGLARYGATVLISDFLQPLPDIAAGLSHLAGRNQSVHLVQVLDAAEETLPFTGRVRFEGLENEGAFTIDRTEDARAAYMARMAAHREALRNMAAMYGWSFAVHRTDASPQLTLVALHRAIGERHR
ncbi:MAG: DUF58 domain-containing protein [Rhodospirillaceae bacterium]|nr:DUF58 domain-containing protein [Rhodospirillaceae bacterium]